MLLRDILYTTLCCPIHFKALEVITNLENGRCELAKGGNRPKRESKKPKKKSKAGILNTSMDSPPPEVQVVKKIRKPKFDEPE